MTGFRKKILLICYIVLMGLILIYALFPEDDVKNYLSNRINQNLSSLQLGIGSLDFCFPLSLSLKKVTASRDNDVLFSIDRLKISPRIFSLFSSEKVFSFKGRTCSGEISGTLTLKSDLNVMDMEILCGISGINIAEVPAVDAETDLEFQGRLSGDFHLNVSAMNLENGDGNFIISDCSFKSPVSLPNLKQLNFSRIDSSFILDRNNLEIVTCNVDGSDVTGDVSGNIYLDSPMSRSDLDLEITAKLLLSSALSEINTYTFKVTGTFEAPKFAPVSFR